MPKRKSPSTRRRTSNGSRRARASSSRAASRSTRQDAIALLKADHREAEALFKQFESTRSADRKRDIAARVCKALTVHAQIEEELFYPAYLEATGDDEMHHEAAIEHDGAKKLIAEIEQSGPEDEYFDARVSVLSEMVKHHVKEEEKRDGMFAKIRKTDVDLVALGEQLKERKMQLMGEAGMTGGARSRRAMQPAAVA